MNRSYVAAIKAFTAVIQRDLRDRAEDKVADCIGFHDQWQQDRRDTMTDDLRQMPARGNEPERLVRCVDQSHGESATLRLECIEDIVIRLAGENRLQLPGEIDRVADPCIHALSANGRVNVGSVAEKKRAALPKLFRHPMADMIN